VKARKRIWLLWGLALVVVAGGAFLWKSRAGSEPKYRTQAADRGPVEVTVSATGTIQPVEKVEVGSQVSGTIAWLGADFNDRVRKGQVLARLDPALFQTAVAQADANLARAVAGRDEAARTFERAKELAARNVIARVELDAAEATYAQRRAEVRQAQATLQNARVNLNNATITSPIDGVVIARAVDKGQTVASAMSAPRLFQIAGDLTRMQVETKIDEADIGRVAAGLSATFTVDAFPDDTFQGTVRQVRFEPLAEQNVVTYTTVIDVLNPELKLKPGMTANVTIRIEKKDDVLRVPNAALRFRPPDAAGGRGGPNGARAGRGGGPGGAANASAATEGRAGGRRGAGRDSTRVRGGGGRDSTGGGAPERKPATIYVLGADGKPTPVRVLTGITDGTYTEVRSRELTAGQEVVVGAITRANPETMAAPPGLGGRPAGGGGGGGRRRGF
jgi:HlyD family secretion protein